MIFPFNSRRTEYKTPFGAAAVNTPITINFPVPDGLTTESVWLIARGKENKRVKLQKKDGVFSATFSFSVVGIYMYRFEVHLENGIIFVGNDGNGGAVSGDWLPEWQLTVYQTDDNAPEWIKGGVMYHIFADRFARVEDGEVPEIGYLKAWNDDVSIGEDVANYKADDFFGGNIKGIISKLGYLKELSVSVIYLSPIFKSSSNHRYDTGDYFKLDKMFGTEDEFAELIAECKKLGIAVILDGVFNHTGADSVYFNKFNRYKSVGAYQSEDSVYHDWYTFFDFPNKYDCWWGVTVVPSIKKDCSDFWRFITDSENGVIAKWNAAGIAGWRLDVVDELSSEFVKLLNKSIKSGGKNVMIGEVWEDASNKESYSEKREYFLGGQLDGVTNYPFRTAILDFLTDADAEKFKNAVMTVMENYPKHNLDCSMTLIGTHDTVRAINYLSDAEVPTDKKDRLKYRLSKEEYALGKKRLEVAACIQYFLSGIPVIYYGDEAGLQGFDDPVNRRPFPKNPDAELQAHYKMLGKLRVENKESFIDYPEIIAEKGKITIKRKNLSLTADAEKGQWTLEY